MGRRSRAAAVVLAVGAVLAAAEPAAAAGSARTLVFRDRVAGQVAMADWTSCPAPSVGQVCTDVSVLAADARSVSGDFRDRTTVLRVFGSAYRVVEGDGGELSAVLVAEWSGRLEGATVQGDPRLDRLFASGTIPIRCNVIDPSAGLTCLPRQQVTVSWTGEGPRQRISEHTVQHMLLRIENTWTRGWQRAATAAGTIDGDSPGVLLSAVLFRVDQGQLVVQHPVG